MVQSSHLLQEQQLVHLEQSLQSQHLLHPLQSLQQEHFTHEEHLLQSQEETQELQFLQLHLLVKIEIILKSQRFPLLFFFLLIHPYQSYTMSIDLNL